MGRVQDEIAIVTGGAVGIGRAAAQHLAQEGAAVAITDLNDEEGEATAAQIRDAGGSAQFYPHDVTEEDDWKRVVDAVTSDLGLPTVLVNNAGIYLIKALEETTVEEWRRLMDVNVTGGFLGMKHVVPAMRNAERGSIINLSSVAGLVGSARHVCYGASKGAVRTMTKDAAIELADAGIRVNSVHPAYVDTGMADYGAEMNKVSKDDLNAMHPIGFMGQPEDVAYAVVYLASPESRFVTGAELVLDGGYTAQ